jgi:hypothetical protein
VGDKLRISGTQGPRAYPRDRQVSVDIDPEQIEAMLTAYEEGGDRGLHDWMADYLDNNYVASRNRSAAHR